MTKVYLGWIIISLVTGFASYLVAKKKGRNAAKWFVLGVIFNVITLITLSLTKNLKTKKEVFR